MTLLVAVIVGASLDHIAHTHFDPVTLDPKLAPLLAPSGLNRKQFAREGFVLVRGLLRGELLREAQEAGTYTRRPGRICSSTGSSSLTTR